MYAREGIYGREKREMAVSAVRRSLSRLHEAVSAVRRSLSRLHEAVSALRRSLSRLHEAVSAVRRSLTRLHEAVSALRRSLTSLHGPVDRDQRSLTKKKKKSNYAITAIPVATMCFKIAVLGELAHVALGCSGRETEFRNRPFSLMSI